MTKEAPSPNDQAKGAFDLEERTAVFGEAVISFAKAIPQNAVTSPLISQIVHSSTSVGANYCEADDAGTKKDFKYKIGICRKEARETKHWLRMIAAATRNIKPRRVNCGRRQRNCI